jgi:hypothetical protein
MGNGIRQRVQGRGLNLFEAMSQNLREQVTGYPRIQIMEQPENPELPYGRRTTNPITAPTTAPPMRRRSRHCWQ